MTASFEPSAIASEQVKLAADGRLLLDLKTERQAGIPRIYRLEGDVEDVSRQHIANRASIVVHPAPWYIGVRTTVLLPRAEGRIEDGDHRRGAQRRDGAGYSSVGDPDADPVDERPSSGGQRVLHLGHRARN